MDSYRGRDPNDFAHTHTHTDEQQKWLGARKTSPPRNGGVGMKRQPL